MAVSSGMRRMRFCGPEAQLLLARSRITSPSPLLTLDLHLLLGAGEAAPPSASSAESPTERKRGGGRV